MKIIMMNGGLGNQVFQYIFFRYMEEMCGDVCYIDDSFFHIDNPQHNGYELEKVFSLRPNRLSQYFSDDIWKEIMRITYAEKEKNIIELLRDYGLPLAAVSEGSTLYEAWGYKEECCAIPMNDFNSAVTTIEGNAYYYGYWINALWFASIKDKMLKELTFPDIQDEENTKMLQYIETADSAGIHIRRGDFVTLGWSLPLSWYAQSIQSVRKVSEKPVFFIFTDDVPWVKEHIDELGIGMADELYFSEANLTGGRNYIDLQLMTRCKKLIIANSSFSYLAALLNQTPGKLVLSPTPGRKIL